MLSRVADSLYWLSRYLERAEHTARVLDVNLHQMLDETSEAAARRWDRVLASLRMPAPPKGTPITYDLVASLTVDAATPASILSCIAAARDNARQVWEQTNSEMWEQCNRLYLQVRGATMPDIWHAEPHAFFVTVKEGVQLFHGITDSTMRHGEGWQFIQLGRFIERVSALASLLAANFPERVAGDPSGEPFEYLELVGLLKSCTAFEAYVKVHTADIRAERVAAFLLLDAEFPHSARFCAAAMQAALQTIAQMTESKGAGRPERLAGRLRAALDYGQIEEIMADGLNRYLEQIQRQCGQIHGAIHQTYVSYPIGAALSSRRRAG